MPKVLDWGNGYEFPKTSYRWLDDPDFAAAYRKATLATYRQAIGRLQQSSGALGAVLVTVMRDPAATAPARVRAADGILRHAKTATETEQDEFSAGVSDVAEYHALRAVQQRTADERHKAYMDFVNHKKAHQG